MSAPAAIRLIELPDLAATKRLAAAVATLARPGDAILLEGPLGAGKTEFARAFLRAATGDPALEVPSPTFTLVQSYETRLGPVHHFDLWRLTARPPCPNSAGTKRATTSCWSSGPTASATSAPSTP